MPLVRVKHEGCCDNVHIIVMDSSVHTVRCSKCNAPYQDTWLKKELFCPFGQQVNVSCAIVLKPNQGFFQEYRVGNDLHVGISDSHGRVHSFTANGLLVEDNGWDSSILLCQVRIQKVVEFLNDDTNWFDQTLSAIENMYGPHLLAQNYQPNFFNCFDFVLRFYVLAVRVPCTKVQFVQKWVLEALRQAGYYCKLVEIVEKKGFLRISKSE